METRIKEEMEANPALEYDEPDMHQDILDSSDEERYNQDDFEEENLQEDQNETFELDDYLKSEEDEKSSESYEKDKNPMAQIGAARDFHQYLLDQLSYLELTEQQHTIATHIIGSINEEGYLTRDLNAMVDDLAFRQNVYTTVPEIEGLLKEIQKFDPSGVGATSLQECLIIQLLQKQNTTEASQIALKIISQYFDAFLKKQFDKIQAALKIAPELFDVAIEMIKKLNPKPGSAFAGTDTSNHYVIPDFFVENNEGVLKVFLNAKNAPELRVSPEYQELLQTYSDKDKKHSKSSQNTEAVQFIKQKMEAAQWFIDAVKQRQTTLLLTMNTIVKLQKKYFLSGDQSDLKPMILKDIAEVTGQDVSTVSRVTNSKYVQTPFGTFLLKHFFSEAFVMDNGKEVSNKEIKQVILELIAQEDKKNPLKDEDIVGLLEAKKFPISRRTVAKYREQLQIPVARLRKA